MRAVMVMYDSLRLDMLPSYGGKEVELPNFRRLYLIHKYLPLLKD